jgi:hypothetical protein
MGTAWIITALKRSVSCIAQEVLGDAPPRSDVPWGLSKFDDERDLEEQQSYLLQYRDRHGPHVRRPDARR